MDRYIVQLQSTLNRLGYKIEIDGDMGEQTLGAFNKLLADNNLTPKAEPTTDPSEWVEGWDDELEGVHPSLQKVVRRAGEITPIPFRVIEGVRSKERCYQIYGQGRTASQCKARGVPAKYAKPNLPKRTWLNNPLNSKHCKKADGYGHAVDLFPFPYDWNKIKAFDKVAVAMYQASLELGIPIKWGANWDNDNKWHERGEYDSPHFQLDF